MDEGGKEKDLKEQKKGVKDDDKGAKDGDEEKVAESGPSEGQRRMKQRLVGLQDNHVMEVIEMVSRGEFSCGSVLREMGDGGGGNGGGVVSEGSEGGGGGVEETAGEMDVTFEKTTTNGVVGNEEGEEKKTQKSTNKEPQMFTNKKPPEQAASPNNTNNDKHNDTNNDKQNYTANNTDNDIPNNTNNDTPNNTHKDTHPEGVEWGEGEMFWVRVSGHPWWPCISYNTLEGKHYKFMKGLWGVMLTTTPTTTKLLHTNNNKTTPHQQQQNHPTPHDRVQPSVVPLPLLGRFVREGMGRSSFHGSLRGWRELPTTAEPQAAASEESGGEKHLFQDQESLSVVLRGQTTPGG